MREALVRQVASHAPSEGENPTAVDGLVLFRHTEPSARHPAMCEPSLSVFVQGRKLINLGGTEYLCGGRSFLVSSIDVPIQSQILEASETIPFLSFRLRLDMAAVQEVLSGDDLAEGGGASHGRGLALRRESGFARLRREGR